MESIKKIGRKKRILLLVVVLVAAAICGAVIWGLRASHEQETAMEIETTYLTIQYPKEYKEYLIYEETEVDRDSEVVFSMNYEEKQLELFRFSVTAEAPAVYEGYLNTDNGIMYVAMTGAELDRGAFNTNADESGVNAEMEALYYAMKEGMSAVMQSIEAAPGYSVVKGVFENDKQDGALSYWTVSLPSGITWEETTEGSVYRAAFSGNVGEKKIPLYTISLGDTTAANPIGQFVVKGETKLVSVEVHDPNAAGTLTEEEQATAYVLLDTINDVLQAIREDENFHDQLEPAA